MNRPRPTATPPARNRALAALALGAALLAACSGPPAGTVQPGAAGDAPPAAPRDGRVVQALPDGGRAEGTMSQGRRVGTWHSYYAHGGPRSRVTYRDGLEEGPTEVFYESGLTYYVGQYSQGHEVGTWTFYDEEGHEVKRADYDSTGLLLRQYAP